MMPIPHSRTPQVALQWEDRTHPAVAVAIRGQEACLVLDQIPPFEAQVCLILDWPGGGSTELDGRLRDVAMDGRTASVDIEGVRGDWAPFAEYLGEQE